MKSLDLSEVKKYVSKTFGDSSIPFNTAYQNQEWYKRTLTIIRGVNLFMCAVLVMLFVSAGGA